MAKLVEVETSVRFCFGSIASGMAPPFTPLGCFVDVLECDHQYIGAREGDFGHYGHYLCSHHILKQTCHWLWSSHFGSCRRICSTILAWSTNHKCLTLVAVNANRYLHQPPNQWRITLNNTSTCHQEILQITRGTKTQRRPHTSALTSMKSYIWGPAHHSTCLFHSIFEEGIWWSGRSWNPSSKKFQSLVNCPLHCVVTAVSRRVRVIVSTAWWEDVHVCLV